MTPTELAQELGVSTKQLRDWLRSNSPRAPHKRSQRWVIDRTTADAARAYFQKRAATRSSSDKDISASASHGTSLEKRLADFMNAPLLGRREVLRSPCPVPGAPGIYGWWFRAIPATIDTGRCLARDGVTLLYTGISPRRPPANGKPPSGQTLRDRITYHYGGNAEGSTLRKTLGILLGDALGIELRRVGSGKRMTFVAGERRLSEWMDDNALVGWLVDPAPWLVEERFIAKLDVPLNLDGNRHNRFHAELTNARATAVARARALPVVENPGIGGRSLT